jgi:hypothetical protein
MLVGFFLSDAVSKGMEYALGNLPIRAVINAAIALVIAGAFWLVRRRKRTFR